MTVLISFFSSYIQLWSTKCHNSVTHDLLLNIILFAWSAVCKFMTGHRFLDLGQIFDIPNFTKILKTNEACGAFFAALRDKFSICNHVKI